MTTGDRRRHGGGRRRAAPIDFTKETTMSAFNPASPSAAALEPPPDIQQLVTLLGSLMPLLQRFQSQALGQPLAAGFGNVGFGNLGLGNVGLGNEPGNVAPPDPVLDHQAAVNLVSDITADALRNLSAYLEAHAGRHAGLDQCVPIVTQAARRFAMRDYAQSFNLIWQAYRAIAMIRVTDPQLPPLRTAGPVAPADQSTAIH
jgi:hypothetical protein